MKHIQYILITTLLLTSILVRSEDICTEGKVVNYTNGLRKCRVPSTCPPGWWIKEDFVHDVDKCYQGGGPTTCPSTHPDKVTKAGEDTCRGTSGSDVKVACANANYQIVVDPKSPPQNEDLCVKPGGPIMASQCRKNGMVVSQAVAQLVLVKGPNYCLWATLDELKAQEEAKKAEAAKQAAAKQAEIEKQMAKNAAIKLEAEKVAAAQQAEIAKHAAAAKLEAEKREAAKLDAAKLAEVKKKCDPAKEEKIKTLNNFLIKHNEPLPSTPGSAQGVFKGRSALLVEYLQLRRDTQKIVNDICKPAM